MKKKLIYPLTCLALLTGCTDNEAPHGIPADERPSIVLNLSNEAKTADGSTANITYPELGEDGTIIGTQHAQTVYLYIFEGSGNGAECVSWEEVPWEEHFMELQDSLPIHTAQMRYKLQYEGFQPNTTYTLMGVGLSDGAETVYGFPDALQTGTTLGEAIASLASGQTCDGIRASEIYVGTVEYKTNQYDTRIELFRRVAGVMGYFKNVPSNIDGKHVTNLHISLYTEQNTQMPLVEREQSPTFRDFIDSPTTDEDGKVLVSIPLGTDDFGATKVVSGGSYVLPAAAPTDASSYTLRIEAVDAGGTILKTWRAKLPEGDELDQGETGGGTGIIDTESAFRFPIVANHFYALGRPADEDGDGPIDLEGAGQDIVITIDPMWREEVDLDIKE